MCLMDNAVQYCIRYGRIREEAMPLIRRILAGDQQGTRPHAPINHIKQHMGRLHGHATDTEVIKYQ